MKVLKYRRPTFCVSIKCALSTKICTLEYYQTQLVISLQKSLWLLAQFFLLFFASDNYTDHIFSSRGITLFES